MAKRFLTTELFKDAWFIDLPNKYKLFWIFLITDCDHAGVWQVNYKTASFYVGDHLEPGECERFLKDRFIKIEEGKYWFIPKFIDFQYGRELNYSNSAVKRVIDVLKKYDLFDYLPKTNIIEGANKELRSSLKGGKEQEQEQEQDKVQLKEQEIFNEFRKYYPGTKRGLETEFKDFQKHKDWRQVLSLLKPALDRQINYRKIKQISETKPFIPEWKHLKTWIHQRSWEDEISESTALTTTVIGRM